ncbi:MAG TPA: alpha-ketoglutarate-dependent dioxygenase AlkB [Gemmataceae bacterium]|jgi:alkylated DNA repair dioxygenase AlkB|nr:alpha-ketoglutarate-dependent dioxygenase AlkB [Gemmataceae bacterium]
MVNQRSFPEFEVSHLEDNVLGVKGLVYLPNLLTFREQHHALDAIDARPWRDDLKRRVQHYGYKYDYKGRAVDQSMYVGALPEFAMEIGRHLLSRGLVEELPDQLIVNEYQPGQGISAHVDCEPCFKDTIVTVSLGSTYEMDFINLESGQVRSKMLDVGSALVLKEEARYAWMHRIKARKSDHGVPRGRRVSLTYRNVILAP